MLVKTTKINLKFGISNTDLENKCLMNIFFANFKNITGYRLIGILEKSLDKRNIASTVALTIFNRKVLNWDKQRKSP